MHVLFRPTLGLELDLNKINMTGAPLNYLVLKKPVPKAESAK